MGGVMRNDTSMSRALDPRRTRDNSPGSSFTLNFLWDSRPHSFQPEIGNLLMAYFVNFSGAEVNGKGQGA